MNAILPTERTRVTDLEENRMRSFCFPNFRDVHAVAGNFREPQTFEKIVQQFDKYLRDKKEKNVDGKAYTTGQIKHVLEKMAEDGSLECTFKKDENEFVQIDKIRF